MLASERTGNWLSTTGYQFCSCHPLYISLCVASVLILAVWLRLFSGETSRATASECRSCGQAAIFFEYFLFMPKRFLDLFFFCLLGIPGTSRKLLALHSVFLHSMFALRLPSAIMLLALCFIFWHVALLRELCFDSRISVSVVLSLVHNVLHLCSY